MREECRVRRRHQFCGLCGQPMFEYFCSPDGHFGLVDSFNHSGEKGDNREIYCPTCGARYRLLERLNPMGAPVERRRAEVKG